jgi:hypothetical protein
MASAQEPCLVKFYVQRPNNTRQHIYQNRVELLGPGGSADGTIASTATPDVLLSVAPRPDIVINRGDKLIISVKADASDGIDVSDSRMLIPFRDTTGGQFIVTDSMLTMSDITVPATNEVDLAEYEFEQGPFVFGGGKIFVSVEDDTA